MDVILPVLVDPGISDEQVGGILREHIGMDKLREVSAINWKPLPRDHGRLAAALDRVPRRPEAMTCLLTCRAGRAAR